MIQIKSALNSAVEEYQDLLTLMKGPESITTNPENSIVKMKRRNILRRPIGRIVGSSRRIRNVIEQAGSELKDAWTGSLGYSLSNWFGLASVERLDNLHSLVDTLFRCKAKMVTIQKLHITAVKNLQSEIDKQNQIKRIINATSTLYEVAASFKALNISMAYLLLHSDFLSAISMFKTKVISYKEIYRTLERGFLDPDVIPSKILADVFQQIKFKMLQLTLPRFFKHSFDIISKK